MKFDQSFVTCLLILQIVVTVKTAANCTDVIDSLDNATVALILHGTGLTLDSKQLFNIVGTDGFIQSESGLRPGTCERRNVSIVIMTEKSELGIYDPQALAGIQKADLIFGPEIGGIEAFLSQVQCEECSAVYFFTRPVGTDTERMLEDIYLRGDLDFSASYSLWPSPTSLINCVVGNTILHTKHIKNERVNVVLLVYAQSEDSIHYISRLSEKLEKANMDVMIFDLYLIANLNIDQDTVTLNEQLKQLNRMVNVDNPAHFVIFYMDTTLDVQLQTLSVLLSKRSGLDREGAVWLWADIEILSDSFAEGQINKLDVVNIELLGLKPCLHPDDLSPMEILETCFANPRMSMKGVEYKALKAGKTLLEAVIRRRTTNDPGSASFIKKVMQVDCPKYINVTEAMLNSSDLLECEETESVRRLGFPRYDVVLTDTLFPKGVNNMPALYLPREWFDELQKEELSSAPLSAVIDMADYVVAGFSKKEIVQYAVLIPEKPFVMQAKDGTYSGLCVDLYSAAVRKLVQRGIILNLKFYTTTVYGSLREGEWSGVFGELSKNNKTGGTVLGIGQISLTKDRMEDSRFTFSPVFGHTSLTYMTKKVSSSFSNRHLQFMRPFTSNVWLLLGMVFVVSGFYLIAMQAWNPFGQSLPDGSDFNWNESFWHSFLIVTQSGAPFGAVHVPARLYSVFFWFFALVVVGCYTGNLTGFLAGPSTEAADIPWLLKRGYKFALLSNSSVKRTNLQEILELSDEALDNSVDDIKLMDNYTDAIRRVKEEPIILVGTSLIMEYYQSRDTYCSLVVNSHPSFYGQRIQALAFPMRSDWELAAEFKWAMNQLKESGEMQLIYQKWITSGAKCESFHFENDHLRLDWDNFVGLYILLAAGIFVSFICLAFKLGHLKFEEEHETLSEENVENTKEEEEITELADLESQSEV